MYKIVQKVVAASFFLVLSQAIHAAFPQFADLVKQASPAVVNVTAIKESLVGENALESEEMPEFFRRFFDERQRPRGPSAGSGFIISADGYILTNHHVVDGADEISVALSDRRELTASIVGKDELSDLALLKIDSEGLPVAKIGSSKRLQVGEWVLAIGSPFGFELSVTAGIVSAKGRSLPGNSSGNYVPFIQTDVAINPGNSGGPLFNMDGEVVGINSQIFTRSGGFMGLSFAIPMDVAMEVVSQLREHGKVSRGWLGVGIQSLNQDLAESFGLDRPQGALVSRIFPDSPAEEAKLEVGDIILELNGLNIDLSSDLPHIVGRLRGDTEVELVIIRDKERKVMDVVLGSLPEESLRNLSQISPDLPEKNRMGIEVEDLTPQDKNQLGLNRGVLVSRVMEGPAKNANIQKGDVITDINGERVDSKQNFDVLLESLPARVAISVRLVRNRQPLFIAIKLDN
ncbi:MAG: DegQ family serine endoprotease [Pseudomonadota bacterium]|nr:DegQ family serine endoprotease [Pseudomonadota bacterium]